MVWSVFTVVQVIIYCSVNGSPVSVSLVAPYPIPGPLPYPHCVATIVFNKVFNSIV